MLVFNNWISEVFTLKEVWEVKLVQYYNNYIYYFPPKIPILKYFSGALTPFMCVTLSHTVHTEQCTELFPLLAWVGGAGGDGILTSVFTHGMYHFCHHLSKAKAHWKHWGRTTLMVEKKTERDSRKLELSLTQHLLGLIGTKLQIQATLLNEAGSAIFFRHLQYLAWIIGQTGVSSRAYGWGVSENSNSQTGKQWSRGKRVEMTVTFFFGALPDEITSLYPWNTGKRKL